MQVIKVKDNNTLVRDSSTMAILSTNTEAVKRHEVKLLELGEKERQKKEINTLKNDVSDIKDMLQQIIQRMN